MNMDFGQRGIIVTLEEARSFIRKPYINKAPAKLRLGIYYLRKSFFNFLK